ncbi:MAG: RNA 2',3'-cyclic phosphodiesterase [Desulfobacterota bacterium]|nr:RNA 2',3'-cyclic phosphodiesterase [Thermodesulfobacteriota bacterium]
MIRSFLAIELPEALRERIEEVQKELRSTPADVRWVRPEQIHLTLKFFGNIEASRIESILQAIEEPLKTTPPASIEVQGMGAFPNLNHPRVVWVGIKEEGKILISLQKRLEERLRKVGFKPEDRDFHPHLTLGRVRSNRGREELIRGMERHRDEIFGAFRMEKAVLFKSDLTPQGPIYTALKEMRIGS